MLALVVLVALASCVHGSMHVVTSLCLSPVWVWCCLHVMLTVFVFLGHQLPLSSQAPLVTLLWARCSPSLTPLIGSSPAQLPASLEPSIAGSHRGLTNHTFPSPPVANIWTLGLRARDQPLHKALTVQAHLCVPVFLGGRTRLTPEHCLPQTLADTDTSTQMPAPSVG